MRVLRPLLLLLFLAACASCGGDDGGSSSLSSANIGPWERFRRDTRSAAQGVGDVFDSEDVVKWARPVDEPNNGTGTPSPVSASPAIALDGIVYVGSEGGTLKAFGADDGDTIWVTDRCDACASGTDSSLGPLISSPAAYTLNARTTVMVGSDSGALFVFEGPAGEAPACTVCFRPDAARDFGGNTRIVRASIRSSPNFTLSELTLSVASVLVGADLEVERNGGTGRVGKVYSINPDGSLRWQFPAPGAADIGPVTSSPSRGVGGTVHAPSEDGSFYILNSGGRLRSTLQLGNLRHSLSSFANTPASPDAVFIGSADGTVYAFNVDGSLRFAPLGTEDSRCPQRAGDDSGFAGSVAVGVQNLGPTPTPTSTVPPDVTPEPEPTPTPLSFNSTLYGLTSGGTFLVIDANTGRCVLPSGPPPTPVSGAIVSSPAQSADLFLVFGTTEGLLYALNSGNGNLPQNWDGPVSLTGGAAIRSSPAIGTDGTIYVGADDGFLYAVGTVGSP